MNRIYKTTVTPKSRRKYKTFPNGELEKAMEYGWRLSNRNIDSNVSFFIITENEKCLRFNKTIIV